jgi:hypothetical protein
MAETGPASALTDLSDLKPERSARQDQNRAENGASIVFSKRSMYGA